MNNPETVTLNVALIPRLTNITLSFDGENVEITSVKQKCEIDSHWLEGLSHDLAQKTGLPPESVEEVIVDKVMKSLEQHLKEGDRDDEQSERGLEQEQIKDSLRQANYAIRPDSILGRLMETAYDAEQEGE